MIPTRTELIAAYADLQHQPRHISESQFVAFAEWCRFDARLAQLFVEFTSQHFAKLNPFQIWQLNSQQKYPQVLLTLLDITEIKIKSGSSSPEQSKTLQWKVWKKCIEQKISKVPLQSFYVGLATVNPPRQMRSLESNLNCYARWGFYCDELPIQQKALQLKRTLLPKPQRFEVLKKLFANKKSVKVQDYLLALNHQVHRRQAERDLAEFQAAQL